jgi:hypothetical protein
MEPNNLELEIKKKLIVETIQPSALAWDRLEAMLDNAEKLRVFAVDLGLYRSSSFYFGYNFFKF